MVHSEGLLGSKRKAAVASEARTVSPTIRFFGPTKPRQRSRPIKNQVQGGVEKRASTVNAQIPSRLAATLREYARTVLDAASRYRPMIWPNGTKARVMSRKVQATATLESARGMTGAAPLSQTVLPIIVTSSNSPITSEIQLNSETGCLRASHVTPARAGRLPTGISA